MPGYNVERFLADAVFSLFNQTMAEWELILINDGSKDKTQKLMEGFSEMDGRVRFFDFLQNQGKASCVNLGVDQARGKFVSVFDCDDVMVNYKLEVSTGVLQENPKNGLLYGDAYLMSARGKILSPLVMRSHQKKRIDHQFIHNQFSFERLLSYDFIPGGSVLFRKKDFVSVGGMDPKLLIGEDWDLWIRLTENRPGFYLPVPLFLYRLNPEGLTARFGKKKSGKSDVSQIRSRYRK